jgi:hypothetical protein
MHAEDASVQFGESFFSNVAQRIYPCMQRWLDSVSLSRLFLLRRREKGRSLHLQACYMQRVYCARTHTRQHLLVRDNILSIHAVYIMLYTFFFLKGPAIAGFRFSLVGRNIYIVILRSRRNQKGIIEKKIRTVKKKLS